MTDPLQRLAREVARNLGDGPGPVRRERQRAAVARLTAAPRPRREPNAWWLLPLAAAVLLAMFLARPATLSAPLTVTVAQQAVMVGAWLAAPEREALVLDFSDDSRAELAARAAARLTRAEPAHVELALERGTVTLHVVAVPDRAWSVSAGPFTVALTDADASATWISATATLIVEVHRGSVDVAGPDGATHLRAGQRLELRDRSAEPGLLARSDVPITPHANASPAPAGDLSAEAALLEASSGPTPAAAPSADAPLLEAQAIDRPSGPRASPPAASSSRSAARSPAANSSSSSAGSPAETAWIALAEAGDCAAALAAAERHGLSQLHATLAAADLDLLAHCARVAGDAPRARDALLALRRRFPADPRAHTAAFLLGRVALDLDRDPARAADWFKKYLSEAPDGALAADARRRLDELDALH
ncbi:tetratricopeptide repeat protein [Nannocystis punicea]|uniref:Tetratricopeptide repeat protein n=1 Tax=Nannocystis punicea TaxID=2995304 RepID=A0ABY7H331_9BACT|nr:tetratricopeptide repeat protein [Nannocystis poenicansa]WAS93683.1 tetratricopeptide repeat protein [Nannocystis poenicansa]